MTIPGWWDACVAGAKTFATGVQGAIDAVWTWLSGTFGPAISNFFTVTIPGWWDTTFADIKSTGASIIGWFTALPGNILAAVGNLGSLLVSGGENLIGGMLTGIKNVWDTVVGWFAGLPAAILKALGINSPPQWSIDAGTHIMNGILKGLAHGASDVKAFFLKLATDVSGPLASAWKASAPAGLGGSGGPQPAGSNAANIALAEKMAAAVGWTGLQWSDLYYVIMAESGGSSTITNPSSGAAGIAQNIAGFGPGYESGNAAQQIAWMISYIQGRYGTPEAAWAHEQADNWYGAGGMITEPIIGFGASGKSYGFGERGPELVSPGGGMTLAGIAARLERLIAVTAAVPLGVGSQMGGAIGGAAAAASFRQRYPRGGA